MRYDQDGAGGDYDFLYAVPFYDGPKEKSQLFFSNF